MHKTVMPERAILSLKFLNIGVCPFFYSIVLVNIKSSETLNKIQTQYQKSNIKTKQNLLMQQSCVFHFSASTRETLISL